MGILKQLVESMIADHLEESYEDDFLESIFEEISPEVWDSIHEAILNELSPELKARYAQKAAADAIGRSFEAGQSGSVGKNDARKLSNRGKGIDTALKGLGAKKKDREATKTLIGHASKYAADAGHQNKMGFHGAAQQTASAARANLQGAQHNIAVVAKNKDAKEMSGADFQKKYKMTKAEWKRKSK